MNDRAITCVGCPMGCRLNVRLEHGKVVGVEGAGCGRGAVYAAQECVCPTRGVTSLVRVAGQRRPLSVKTSKPVPKEKIFACLEAIHGVCVAPPVRIGAVLVRDVCGTGADVVATAGLGNGR